MKITLNVWRQSSPQAAGAFVKSPQSQTYVPLPTNSTASAVPLVVSDCTCPWTVSS